MYLAINFSAVLHARKAINNWPSSAIGQGVLDEISDAGKYYTDKQKHWNVWIDISDEYYIGYLSEFHFDVK